MHLCLNIFSSSILKFGISIKAFSNLYTSYGLGSRYRSSNSVFIALQLFDGLTTLFEIDCTKCDGLENNLHESAEFDSNVLFTDWTSNKTGPKNFKYAELC